MLEIVRGVIAANAEAVAQYRAGKQQTFGFLVGQVMKGSGGKANPKLANALLKRELDAQSLRRRRVATGIGRVEASSNTRATGPMPRVLAVVITTHNLSKLYGRGLYALRDLTVTMGKGEFVFLTGPSGAGKSTFLRLLLMKERRTRARSSSTATTSRACRAPKIQEYRRGIGFVFQDFKLIQRRTVLENISFVSRSIGVSPAQQRRRAFQVLKWVGLQHRMNAYPQELSGGEQQRISIARAS